MDYIYRNPLIKAHRGKEFKIVVPRKSQDFDTSFELNLRAPLPVSVGKNQFVTLTPARRVSRLQATLILKQHYGPYERLVIERELEGADKLLMKGRLKIHE